MAHSGKTITFATDLLPHENNVYNLGDNTHKWKIYGEVAPLASKTYTNVIATANNQNGAGFFYAKVRGNNYNEIWHTKIRIIVSVPNNTNFYATSIYELWGITNTYISYKCQNAIRSTSYRPVYYNTYFRINQAGYTHNMGGWLGFSLLSSNNPTDTNLKRTVTVELLEHDNCTVELQNDLITPTNIPNRTTNGYYQSTNTNYDNFDFCTNGLQETGDANTNDTAGYIRQMQNAAYVKPTTAMGRYILLLDKGDGEHVIPIHATQGADNEAQQVNTKSNITTAAFNIFGPIEYYSTATNIAAENNIDGRYHWSMYSGVDIRYSFNTGATLTAYKDVYIVATLNSPTTAKLRNPQATGDAAKATVTGANAGPITQTLPTTEDGFIYIKLGHAYGTSAIILTQEHPVYIYKNGALQLYHPYAEKTALLMPISDTTTTSKSTWNIPTGCVQVWGQRFSDNTLKYTPSGGTETIITDTGDWTMWLKPSANTNTATLNMRIDGTYYGNFSGTLSGAATSATNDSEGHAINTTYLKLSGGTMTGGITLPSKDTAFNTYNLVFSSGGIIGGNTSGNIGIYAGTIYLRGGSNNTTNSGQGITVTGTQVDPYATNEVSLGTSSLKYKNIYATTFTGNLTGNATNDSDGNAINTTYVKKVESTLNAIAKFSGTDGQIQNSKAILNDNGGLTLEKTAENWPSSLAMLTLKGANSKDFKFSFSGSGTNVDIGYNWSSADGAGAAFRSSSFNSNADNANNGAFVFYARKKVGNNVSNYELLGNTAGLLTWDTKRVATYDGATNDYFTVASTLRVSGASGNKYILIGNTSGTNGKPGVIYAGNGEVHIGTGTDWTSNVGGTFTPAIATSRAGSVTIGSQSDGAFGLAQTNGTGIGISLHNGPKAVGALEYGIMFAKTATFGTCGSVTSDWATYFTMNRNDARGWIFKSNGGAQNTNNNVASIAGNGNIYTAGTVKINSVTLQYNSTDLSLDFIFD